MIDEEYNEFMPKCANVPYKDYSWLKNHCYRMLKLPCSPNTRNEHLAVLDLIKEHEEQQRTDLRESYDYEVRKAYNDGEAFILDMLRKEMELMQVHYNEHEFIIEQVLEIIDKYKEGFILPLPESEE